MKRLLAIVGTVNLLASLVLQAHVLAAPNYNNLIDDPVFDNSSSMSAGQIDNWLNSNFPKSCISTRSGRTFQDPVGFNPSQGFLYGPYVSGAKVVADAAQAYGLNPQAILATLEKESSVVSGEASYGCNYLPTAMGYDCPDSGSCPRKPATEWGFSQQVINATWFLSYTRHHSEGQNNWYVSKPGWDNSDDITYCYSNFMSWGGPFYRCPDNLGHDSDPAVTYSGLYNIDGGTVRMENGATAALYVYTPHLHGQDLFTSIFISWFGSPYSNCTYPQPVANGIYRLYNPGTGNQLLTTDPYEVCTATHIGWLYDGQLVKDVSSSAGVAVYRLENGGRYLFTASTSERDAAIHTYGYTLDGIAFYGVNSSTDPTNARPVYRLASNIGTYVYTISAAEKNAMSALGYHYEGIGFYLEENPGAAVTSTYRLSNTSGAYLFTTSTAERDNAVLNYGYKYEGVGFNAITQLNSNTVPVYRLAGGHGYLLTTNLKERANATRSGWRNEGATMFTYGGTGDPDLNNVYRLSRSPGTYFYTTSTTESNTAVKNYNFKLEGIGFQSP